MTKDKECVCKYHDLEKGDTLYICSSWDGGVQYEYIEDIQFCPVCGKELPPEASRLRRLHERTDV